jgi:DNA polymerase-3 subunit beta
MQNNTEFTIKTSTIKALLLFSAKKDIRHYLNGIFFESCENGINSIATDGHALIAVRESFDTIYSGLSSIIPREALERAVKTKTVSLIITTDNERFTISDGSSVISGNCEDGRFPDYRRVIPRAISNQPATYNAELLLNFEKANKLLTGISRPKVFQNGSDGALVVFSGTSHAIGVVMPMRDTEDFTHNIPHWVTENVTKALEMAA